MKNTFSFLFAVFAQIILVRSQKECGIIPPTVKHYIYGGKSTMIEQWPWQVTFKTLFQDY